MMTDAEFRNLVRQMRAAQSRWFNPKTRTQEVLELSRSLERQVDRELAKDGQKTLFDREESCE
jgi:hypothetical protein